MRHHPSAYDYPFTEQQLCELAENRLMTPTRLATRLGVPLNAVRYQLRRARQIRPAGGAHQPGGALQHAPFPTHRHRWTEAQLTYLRKHLGQQPAWLIALSLGLSRPTVKYKIQQLKRLLALPTARRP